MDGQPGLRAGRGGQPAVVRPAPAGRDQGVGALGQRRPDQELEVAQLVAAEAERQEVLALDPDVARRHRAPPRTAAARQRRGRVEEREARQGRGQ